MWGQTDEMVDYKVELKTFLTTPYAIHKWIDLTDPDSEDTLDPDSEDAPEDEVVATEDEVVTDDKLLGQLFLCFGREKLTKMITGPLPDTNPKPVTGTLGPVRKGRPSGHTKTRVVCVLLGVCICLF